jgi:hypothetical protein
MNNSTKSGKRKVESGEGAEGENEKADSSEKLRVPSTL